MIRSRHIAGTLFCCASAAALFAFALASRAESALPRDHLTSPSFELIAHCRAEEVEGRLLYKVLDVWRGKYNPAAFAKQPPAGYINAMGGDSDRRLGEEVILFYTRRIQLNSVWERPEIIVQILDGRAAIYPRGFENRPYVSSELVDVARLRREIKSRTVSVELPQDLDGNWRMLLTGGFDHRAIIETAGENRYKIFSDGRFNGTYELRDERLVAVEPKSTAAEGYVWKVHSLYMLTLIEQSDKVEPDYRGAVLFRPLPFSETAPGKTRPAAEFK